MATGFREGRVGQVDLAALRRRADVKNPWEPFDRLPPEATHRWVSFYTLDIGYSLIVEAARVAFPTLPDNHLRALALQLVFDAAMVFFVCFIFAQWHVVLGLLTAYLYVSNGPFYNLVSFPYYYYWDIPIAFIVLDALLLALPAPRRGARVVDPRRACTRLRRLAARILVADCLLPVRARGGDPGVTKDPARPGDRVCARRGAPGRSSVVGPRPAFHTARI
jgi:hypothetical protein